MPPLGLCLPHMVMGMLGVSANKAYGGSQPDLAIQAGVSRSGHQGWCHRIWPFKSRAADLVTQDEISKSGQPDWVSQICWVIGDLSANLASLDTFTSRLPRWSGVLAAVVEDG